MVCTHIFLATKYVQYCWYIKLIDSEAELVWISLYNHIFTKTIVEFYWQDEAYTTVNWWILCTG